MASLFVAKATLLCARFETVVRIEFGSRCSNHGLPEFIKLKKMLHSFFPDTLSVVPCPIGFFNHFRVYVGEHLVFDSYSRYPPVIEVVKCIEEVQQEVVPAEIPHSRGIPFSYWRCPEHDSLLVDGQVFSIGGRATQRLSCISSKVTSDTSSSSERGHSPGSVQQALWAAHMGRPMGLRRLRRSKADSMDTAVSGGESDEAEKRGKAHGKLEKGREGSGKLEKGREGSGKLEKGREDSGKLEKGREGSGKLVLGGTCGTDQLNGKMELDNTGECV